MDFSIYRRQNYIGCNLKFVLLGVGYHSPELAEVKQKIQNLHIEDKIMLMPWVSHGDCIEYVRRSSFYLSTAIYEGFLWPSLKQCQ